jgi:hypothetical protein
MGPEDAAFYSRAIGRLYRWMYYAGVLGTGACVFWRGWQGAIAFAAGAAAAYFNFKWLHEAVMAMSPGAPPARGRIFVFLALRYAMLGVGAYAIVMIFGMNAIPALVGLFVPMAAVIIEIVYELAHGT